MSRPILLLSGIPGSGKSSYGRWLGHTKRFLHVDFDQGDLQKHFLLDSFREIESSGAERFIAQLLGLDSPVCLDWGFPPHCLWIVHRLAETGVNLWWFEAEKGLAKKHFLSRPKACEAAFDEQTANIEASRGAIMELFGDHIVHALRPDGTHVPSAKIYAQMFDPMR